MSDQIVENPTYMEHIRHFFEDIDLDHMSQKGIDLSTYESLKANSTDVFFQTLPPNANMPPSDERKWSKKRSDTFKNWIRNGHPFGSPKLQSLKPSQAGRIRKDARNLLEGEIDKLTLAFSELMKRDTDDPDSYFALAGMHWYPLPFKCKHHEDRYNPWHRAYLEKFENALRSVDGCEDVTLPYWDITSPPPEFLFKEPFDSYTLPIDIHANYKAGYKTQRFSANDIETNVQSARISDTITHAMNQPVWGDFVSYTNQGIESAHDAGHGACGPTLSNTDAASFDPIFWFFHSNWDRLWWEWQQIMSATTLWTFRSTIKGNTEFLEPPFNDLDPFSRTADKTIDLNSMGIGYELQSDLEEADPQALARSGFGSLIAGQGILVNQMTQASVRLKGIDRLKIPGSFKAILKSNGELVGQRTFFQSTEPRDCESCQMKAKVNLDFPVDINAIAGKELTVEIKVLTPNPDVGPRMPLHAIGNPTLNVRMLLQEK